RPENTEPPTVGPTLLADVIPDVGVQLDWSYALDDQAISHYIVFRSGNRWITTREQSALYTSIGEGDRTNFYVAAVDINGNETIGNTVVVQLPGRSNSTDHIHSLGNYRHWAEHGDAFVP